jgi:hypothetical protein
VLGALEPTPVGGASFPARYSNHYRNCVGSSHASLFILETGGIVFVESPKIALREAVFRFTWYEFEYSIFSSKDEPEGR